MSGMRSLAAITGAVLLAGAQASSVLAQDQCLALVDSLQLAADQAPEVAAAMARLDEAEADYREARSLQRPQVSTFGRSAVGDNGLTSNQLENQVGVRVSQRVWDFGDARLARDAARGRVEAREFDVTDQRQQAAALVAEAYLSKLEALAMINVISERRDYFSRQQQAVDTLLARGGATRAESAQIAAQLAEAEADVLELRFLADRASTRINEYTGLGTDLCGADQADYALDHYLQGVDTVDTAVSAALNGHPAIIARRGSVRSLEAQSARERRARLPIVDLVGIVSYVYDDTREDWEARDRLGVDVSVPLYSGDAIGARQDRAAARLSQEENGLRALQRSVREDAEIAFRRLLSLQAQLVRREAVADSQQAYFEAIAGEFEFGLGTLPDLVDARLGYEQALLDVVGTRHALLRQKLELMRLTARLPVAVTD